jgi:CIC family chloride channel protein
MAAPWFNSEARHQAAVRVRSFIESPSKFNRNEQRLVLQSVVIGAVVWLPVYLLKIAVHALLDGVLIGVEALPSVVFILVPLLIGAAVTAAIVRYRATLIYYRDGTGHIHELLDVEGDGLERAISLYHASEPSFEQALMGKEGVEVRWEMPTFSLAMRKFGATLATLGSGGSGGLEASVALIGESIAATLFKPRQGISLIGHVHPLVERTGNWWAAKNSDDLQTAQLSGIAAAITVLTGAPFMSAFFAAEVMYRRRPLIEKLIYSLISALVAYFLTTIFSAGHTALFEAEQIFLPPSDWRYYVLIVLMAVIISFVSIYFIRARRRLDHLFHHRLPNLWVRHLIGAALTGLVAIAVVLINGRLGLATEAQSLRLVLSTSDGVVDMALAGQITVAVAAIALVAKMTATLMTISSGGSAGLLIPSLYFGTMVAVVFAGASGYEPMMLIVPAMTASLISIVNVPLAAIMLPVELFSSHYILPALMVLVVCTLLTQDDKIYRTQRETFKQRQIAPGVEVRRAKVPPQWTGMTLIDLDFRRKYELTVIGLLEVSGEDGLPHVRLNSAPTIVLQEGDTLIVLGAEDQLDALQDQIDVLISEAAETPPAA